MLKGFRDFIMRGNVVDLAVAVVIGAAFGNVVNAFVKDFITPLIAAIGGQPDFGKLSFTLNNSTFAYGDFINFLVTFLVIAAVVYFLVVVPLNKIAELRKRRLAAGEVAAEPAAKSDEVLLLEQIRDLLSANSPPAGR